MSTEKQATKKLSFEEAFSQLEQTVAALEQGNLSCDINVSVRPAGRDRLGTKTEI